MCPDPQILSIYSDGELPSPWKEKFETHVAECSACREKLKSYEQLRGIFEKDAEDVFSENNYASEAKDRIWQKLESRRNFRHDYLLRSSQTSQSRQVRRFGVWQRKLSVPLPVAAAAAVVIVILAAAGLYGGLNRQVTQPVEFAAADFSDRANVILAADEEMSGIMPVSDLNSVIQLLESGGTDILIMRLPESKSFFRSGEPAIIRAADYSGRQSIR